MYGDQYKYKQYQEEIPLRESPCPIYLFEESPKYVFRNNFTIENTELIEQRYPGLTKEWNDPTVPLAQIIFAGIGGISANPVWTHLTEDVSNRTGIFRHGRIPISLVTTNIYASRILSQKFNGKDAMLNMGRLGYLVHNYYEVENVSHLDRGTFLKMHDMQTDPYMLCLVPKIEPDSGRISLALYEMIMHQFYSHKELSIRSILRSKILRSEVGTNNFRPDYYAKLVISNANIQNANVQGKTILPADFSRIVKALCDEKIVPRKNLDFKQILKIRPNKYTAKSNFQEKRKIAKLLDKIQYPQHISEMMHKYYSKTIEAYERERSYLPVEFEQDYEEAVRGLGSLPKVADKFE